MSHAVTAPARPHVSATETPISASGAKKQLMNQGLMIARSIP